MNGKLLNQIDQNIRAFFDDLVECSFILVIDLFKSWRRSKGSKEYNEEQWNRDNSNTIIRWREALTGLGDTIKTC